VPEYNSHDRVILFVRGNVSRESYGGEADLPEGEPLVGRLFFLVIGSKRAFIY